MFSGLLVFEKKRTIKQAIGFYLVFVPLGIIMANAVLPIFTSPAWTYEEKFFLGYKGAIALTCLLSFLIIYKKGRFRDFSAILIGILAIAATKKGLLLSGIFLAWLTCFKSHREVTQSQQNTDTGIPNDQKLNLLNIISSGETRNAEFKETFSLETKTKNKEKYLIEGKIKTIAGFLNTDGGTLIIGVDDEGRTIGINEEIALLHGNDDKYLLHFKDVVMKKIGPKFFTLINYSIQLVGNKKLLVIVCQPSNEPIYVNNEKDFFARTGPATEKLEGPTLVEYVARHFEKK